MLTSIIPLHLQYNHDQAGYATMWRQTLFYKWFIGSFIHSCTVVLTGPWLVPGQGPDPPFICASGNIEGSVEDFQIIPHLQGGWAVLEFWSFNQSSCRVGHRSDGHNIYLQSDYTPRHVVVWYTATLQNNRKRYELNFITKFARCIF